MKTVAERIKILESLKIRTSDLKGALVKSLKDRSPTVRGLAVEIIGEKQIDEMLPAVLSLLEDRDSEVRTLAIESIGNLADGGRHSLTLARLLHDKNELVRISAAEILGDIGGPEVLDELVAALNDKSALVRSYAAESIGSIGKKGSISTLERHLLIENDDMARLGLYVGLSLIDGRNVLKNLIDLFQSDDYRLRSAVIHSLDQIELTKSDLDKVFEFLKKSLKKEETIAVKSSIKGALKLLKK